MTPALIGIDWGTTHRRAYLLDAAGHLLAETSDAQGMLACQGRFRPALDALLQAWPEADADVPVLMSGMVGAASGWQEARYLDAATPLAQLAQHVVAVRDAPPGRRWAIVPGYCVRDASGRVDVMRGEETQLLGALALGHGDGWVVLPGTHSKWVRVDGGRIRALRTYMTGELFALLTQHGTLASVAGGAAPDAPEAFEQGLMAAGGAALSNALFSCRARVVTGDMPAAHARSYLSGLLIGAEWSDALRAPEPLRHVTVIGSEPLAARYAVAAAHHGCDVTLLDPREVYLAALNALRSPS